MVDGEQVWESTRSSSRPVALRIWKARESEIALGKFKVGWPGKRIKFEELCDDFERSHFAGISEGTIKGYRAYLKHLKAFFGGFVLTNITTSWSKNIATIAGSNPPFAIKAAPSKVRP